MRAFMPCRRDVTIDSNDLVADAHRAGRALRASATVIGSILVYDFEPKPPPRYGTITRTFESGTSNSAASSARTRNGCWQEACTVISPAVDLRDDGVRLHRVLVDRRERVLALDDVVRVREDRLDLAAVDAVAVTGVAVERRQRRRARGTARVGAAPSWTRSAPGATASTTSPTTGQLLVLDLDRLHGRGGLASSRPRPPRPARRGSAPCRSATIGRSRIAWPQYGSMSARSRAGQHADDAGHRLGGRGVDRDDARVRHRRAQHLPVQHPGQRRCRRRTAPGRGASRRVPARRASAPTCAGRRALDGAHASTPAMLADGLEDRRGSPCSGTGCPRARARIAPRRRRARRSPAARRS